ncbi:MAG: SDR family NAD(P)-dependent oxidoreductase [Bacteroidota bacterium]
MSAPLVLITGSGGALGTTVSQTFQEAGWRLVLAEYSEDGAEALRAQFPDALVEVADLTDAEQAQRVVARAEDQRGPLDAALAIAGGFSMQAAHEATPKDYGRMMDLNVRTLFNTVRAVLPGMRTRRHGFILGVSAAAADHGGAQMALYAASKAAVAAYLRAVRNEVSDHGVGVATLYPMGALDTPANRASMPDADPNQWISREDLAATMLHMATQGPRGHVGEARVFATPR